MNKVAIIGNGWVGRGMQVLFPESFTYVRDYNNNLARGRILEGVSYTSDMKLINEADIAFICVPTPNGLRDISIKMEAEGRMDTHDREGSLNTSLVEQCIAWCEAPLIVVRSTVNPGDCESWAKKYNKQIVFQPEYLGETPAHPLLDTTQTNFIILGGSQENTRKLIELYQHTYNANLKIRQTDLYTAEVIKLTENRAISFKVAQCQELYDICQRTRADYYEVVQAVYGDDPRFNLWWTFVYPDKRGFNSKCIPKDVYAWCAWAESLGYEPEITRALLEKNKEWIK